MRPSVRRIVLIAALCAAAPFVAQAQTDTGRYGQWNAPGNTSNASDPMKGLLKDLNALIAEGEKARAADRMFLRDLKDLAARYTNPWSQRLVFDDFADGDYIRDPQWSVTSGEFWVERGYGLRSKVMTAAPAATSQKAASKVDKKQLALSLLGAFLQQGGAKQARRTQKKSTVTAPSARPAVIKTRAAISNAFAVTTQFSSWNTQGRFQVSVLQGSGAMGYAVAYVPGANGAQAQLELLKITTRGQGLIDSASVAALEDKRTHTLTWTRRLDGVMDLSLDGRKAFTVRDQSFRDGFTAVALTSAGADVIVKSIDVKGVR